MFKFMWFRENPDIFISEITNFFSKEEMVNLNDLGFKIAFGINDYRDGSPKADPNFVKW